VPKLILGDNPFFGISHLKPGKSEGYLQDEARWENAAEIIKAAPESGLDVFMVSTHKETPDLLKKAGYDLESSLPDLCLVVPNVHSANEKAASQGIVGALKSQFAGGLTWSKLRPRFLYERAVLGGVASTKIKYVALHNVVVDLLLGLRAKFAISLFCRATRFFGYKPVLITLNPVQLMKLNVNCEAICCYYNLNGYNVCDDPEALLNSFEKQAYVSELWAMGVVASGAIPFDRVAKDPVLKNFTRVILASSKHERIQSMSEQLFNA
jgi:hypothetical protein